MNDDIQSLTPNAMQRNWKTPSSFAMCPATSEFDGLSVYGELLTFGTVFARNTFGNSVVVVAEEGKGLLCVVSNLRGNVKEWGLTKVTVENGKFIHESLGTYFTLQGALKQHCGLLDVPFMESIDGLLLTY
jgi:hypothetical protein